MCLGYLLAIRQLENVWVDFNENLLDIVLMDQTPVWKREHQVQSSDLRLWNEL